MRALLVYRDGSIGFEEVREDCYSLRKAMRMPLVSVDDFVASCCTTIPILMFVFRGKAGPYRVYEETGVV